MKLITISFRVTSKRIEMTKTVFLIEELKLIFEIFATKERAKEAKKRTERSENNSNCHTTLAGPQKELYTRKQYL